MCFTHKLTTQFDKMDYYKSNYKIAVKLYFVTKVIYVLDDSNILSASILDKQPNPLFLMVKWRFGKPNHTNQ